MGQGGWDVAVVGGGLGGLLTALLLAEAGRRVIVLEGSGRCGGRARTSTKDGFFLNRGPRAVYRAGELASALTRLGIRLRGKKAPVAGELDVGGRLVPLPASPWSLLTSRLFAGRDRAAAAQVLTRALAARPEGLAGQTLGAWVDGLGGPLAARQLVRSLARVSTYDDDDGLCASAAMRQVRRALKGVLYLDEGWEQIASALLARAEAAGVAVTTGASVLGLSRSRPGGSGFSLRLREGAAVHAERVVLALPRRRALEVLASLDDEALLARASTGSGRAVQAAVLDVALARLPRAERTLVLGLDRPLYLSVHSATARLAPAGGAVVHAMHYGETTPGTRAELEALLDDAQPGWRAEVVHARYLPRMEVAGLHVDAASGGLSARPPAALGEGLSLVGDWVGPRGLLADAVAASAEDAVTSVLAEVRRAA